MAVEIPFDIARLAARAYMRCPWKLGKSTVLHAYNRLVRMRPHQAVVRTRFGDLMEVLMPDIIADTIFLSGHWESTITEYVRQALRPGDIFVDVGANIGYYSVLASGLVGERGRVFAIEAHPRICERLKRNVALNGRRNTQVINAAASDSKGQLPLFLGPVSNPGHTTTVSELAEKEHLLFDTTVPADTLERLIGSDNLFEARLIKIDVEGAEHTVLAPLLSSLASFRDSTEWLLELWPEYCAGGQSAIDEIYRAFRMAGYKPLRIENCYGLERFYPARRVSLIPITPDLQREPQDVLMTRVDY